MKICKTVKILLLAFFASISLQFVVMNVFAESGESPLMLQQEIEKQKEKNAILLRDILDKTNLNIISQKSKELGFVKPTNIVYLTPDMGGYKIASLR